MNIKMIDQLPQAIFQKGIKYELVAQEPKGESASVLLERIEGEKVKGGEKG